MDAQPRVAVSDWATDYDIFDAGYANDPVPIWADLRQRCPIAHSTRWGGSWMPTRYADVVACARLVPELSNSQPLVVPPIQVVDETTGELVTHHTHAPPISLDPPDHGPARHLLLRALAPDAVARHEPFTRQLAHRFIDAVAAHGRCDAAIDYAQQIPPRVIARLLGIDPDQADTFVAWVRGALEQGLTNPKSRLEYRQRLLDFFADQVAQRRRHPRNDVISDLLRQSDGPAPMTDDDVVATCYLLLVAGIDTTWSAIGSALWHLATHRDDRARLRRESHLLPTAVEEFLRVYSPVTMARVATQPVNLEGVVVPPGDRTLVNFPAANHDPAVFPEPDRVILGRRNNRHIAFGVGIHRCAGSNLARMEITTALAVFLERIPEFALDPAGEVVWSGGQVRGPRRVPIVF